MKKLISIITLSLLLANPVIASEKTAKIVAGSAVTTSIVATGVTASFFSGASIVSGLAWLGGGTMAVGIGVVAAIPLAVGATAYGTYKLFEDK